MWLTVKEASSHYRIKRSTLYLWVESGSIPHYKVGRLIRFKSEEIDEWMEGFRKESKSLETKPKRRKRTTSNLDINNTIRKAIEEAREIKI